MAANDLSHLLKWESYTLTYFVKNDSVRDDLEIKFLSASSFYLYTRNSFANRTHWFMPTRNLTWIPDEGDEPVFFSLAWWLLFDQLATCSINVCIVSPSVFAPAMSFSDGSFTMLAHEAQRRIRWQAPGCIHVMYTWPANVCLFDFNVAFYFDCLHFIFFGGLSVKGGGGV